MMASSLAELGRHDEAVAAARRAVAESSGNVRSEAGLISALAAAGRRQEAHDLLDSLLDSGDRRFLFPYALAVAHASLEHREESMEWLERAYEERELFLIFMRGEPTLRRLFGDDPRFLALARRMHLA